MDKKTTPTFLIQPRLIRLRDVCSYLGMDRNKFNSMVRPHLTEIPLGKQAVAFDRIEVDQWADQYKARNGRPAGQRKGDLQWDASVRRGSGIVTARGTSKSSSAAQRFEKALALATSRKRN